MERLFWSVEVVWWTLMVCSVAAVVFIARWSEEKEELELKNKKERLVSYLRFAVLQDRVRGVVKTEAPTVVGAGR